MRHSYRKLDIKVRIHELFYDMPLELYSQVSRRELSKVGIWKYEVEQSKTWK